jgi:hypothetical protein
VSGFLADVAGAALPVAIALLVLTAAARGALWAGLDQATQRLAREYLAPLGNWCLIALAAYTVALVGAGEVSALSLGLALILGGAAVLLRLAPARAEKRAAAPAPAPAVPAPAAPATPPPTPAGALWTGPVNDDPSQRVGLWSH